MNKTKTNNTHKNTQANKEHQGSAKKLQTNKQKYIEQ